MIDGVIRVPLKQIHDERGKVMHMLCSTDPHFTQFGEVYFSWIYPDVIKAWRKHLKMIMNYAVPIGDIKIVLHDDRLGSETFGEINEFYMNAEDYYLLTIPNGIWYGFTVVGRESAMIVNCSTMPHHPEEVLSLSPGDPLIPYNWNLKHD